MKLLVTGAAGFIGSNFVHWLYQQANPSRVVVLDALTYAGNLANLKGVQEESTYRFVKGDIRDEELVKKLIQEEQPDVLVNFAAESHVDRSIIDPLAFVRTNVEGTQVLLNAARDLGVPKFLQVSTDEVYGSLGPEGRFTEDTPLDPSSAYSASKAGADLLALACFTTYKQHVMVTRCSNNYGPYQFPEKFIPLFTTNTLEEQPLPLYGDGKNVRSWLHVDDHSRALWKVIGAGRPGEVYNIGGARESEKENVEVATAICNLLGKSTDLIRFVEDRKGHDRRYAVDYSKLQSELGWEPEVTFDKGLEATVQWYVENRPWWKDIKSGSYQEFYQLYYAGRV